MRKRISESTRRLVAQRADFCCEYCLLHENYLFLAFEIDHIISLKHGGDNGLNNLAYACPHCNQHKGSDIATLVESQEDITLVFNPRKQKWREHFNTDNGEIIPITKVGLATLKLLRFNEPDLVILRRTLARAGLYP